ncbi:MAG TPA: hypothetical protein DDZ80_24470 [Cyanobacteria bacterium UBA8803]|nr:hypothetical protein [Cyanobacteria bacterium UBA9273]HBL61465.1 hypothetical protein [Cyanobacteria bacterium UBA8803]
MKILIKLQSYLSVLGIVAASLCLLQSDAWGELIDEEIYRISIEPQVTVPAISAAEILSGSNSQTVATAEELTGLPLPFNPQITRDLPGLWRMQIPTSESPDSLHITYDLQGANGNFSKLSSIDNSSSEITVNLQSLPLTVVSQDPDTALVEGGVRLVLDPTFARVAGKYKGTLTITVTGP